MKHIHTSILAAATTVALPAVANASAASHTHANALSGHNIAIIQHTITQTAFQSFEGASETKLFSAPTQKEPQAPNADPNLYGKMPMYGEYNDDGNAGRNGGDTINQDAMLNSIWFNWQHVNDNIHIDNYSDTDANFNTFMMGLAGGTAKMGNGISEWGIYTGYVDTKQTNVALETKGQGGYFGVYNGFDMGNFSLSSTINGGVIDNSSDTIFGTDEFTNFWVGAAVNAAYNIALDRTFTLQPSLHMGYTWIKSENYTSVSGDILQNDAFNMFELTPEIRAIKHIGNGWYGTMGAKYVMIFENGGDLSVNNIGAHELEIGDFFEYSISVERSVYNLHLSASIGRHEGDHDGWTGGINIKYIF